MVHEDQTGGHTPRPGRGSRSTAQAARSPAKPTLFSSSRPPSPSNRNWFSFSHTPDGRHISSRSRNNTSQVWDAGTATTGGKALEMSTHSVLSVAPSSIPLSSHHNPMHAHFCALPDSIGWARDSEGGLLYWVPPDCRAGLHSPALLTIPLISRVRSVSLNFEDFAFGTSWTQIFITVQP